MRDKVTEIKEKIEQADAIVIGAGAGTFILIDTQMYQNQSTIKYIT